ncbi:MAG TPA: sigma 54-interacting transcriptional regulator [Gemmatimonadaceae bacterium]
MTEQELAQFLLGVSPPIREVRRLILKVARTTLPVLVQGPTGAGKEVVAQALHSASDRRGRFVPFNVCAIPEGIFESVLFGHVKGAFTGSQSDGVGLLTEAHQGTAFFDEIAMLSVAQQVKLLRAIERQEYRPLGARADCHSDFRVVAASNADLHVLAGQGRFRADLVQRLAGVLITVPALDERTEDIRLLVRHFQSDAVRRHGRAVEFTEEALQRFEDYPWPGNVRELRLAVERAIVFADTSRIGPDTIAHVLRAPQQARHRQGDVDAAEREEMLRLLEQEGWNTAILAARLGIHRATIYRWMRRLEIEGSSRKVFRRTRS